MDIVKAIFEHHYNYYKTVRAETIKQQARQLEQVSSDYQGRVLFELLQNAFDKAEKKILVQVTGNTLYVANDGGAFTYAENFDYNKGATSRKDFQALCSISTSNKNINTSIGNKGVGFKSVFSIAEKGYVNVHTIGKISTSNGRIQHEKIHFSLYEVFKLASNLPSVLDESVKIKLREQIIDVQKELRGSGVPGYYYPIRLQDSQNPLISTFFKEGYVTIMEIPFKPTEKDKLKNLFDEIKQIHFEFVQLKQDKDFELNFLFDKDSTLKLVKRENPNFFAVELSRSVIGEHAQNANIDMDNCKIAFRINTNGNGTLYNYLPTQVKSPFKYIDFHADFHTTVDRKTINFDGDIGEYNRMMLHLCIELYFISLNRYLKRSYNADFKLKYIDTFSSKAIKPLSDFSWNLFELAESSQTVQSFPIVRHILQIDNNSYQSASEFLTNLAVQYFSIEKTIAEHIHFFKNAVYFIDYYGRGDGQQYKWVSLFTTALAKKLIEKKAKVIPKVTLSSKFGEILYRKRADITIELPHFLGISITDFEIPNAEFKKALNVGDFGEYNEILKCFKQCSFSGDYSENTLSEDQQKSLLSALMQIFKAKQKQSSEDYLSSHRFTKALTAKLRENNTLLNQANFNISTVFLKTQTGRYKPAQLCKKNELDLTFLPNDLEIKQLDNFLKFIGVSLIQDFTFSDERIYDKLAQGLVYIPALYRIETQDKIDKSLIEHLFIIDRKDKKKHPALINDLYKFLDNIRVPYEWKLELDNLWVKKYSAFDSEYLSVLKQRMGESFRTDLEDIIRFYQKQALFTAFCKEREYLLIENGSLKWGDRNTNFSVLLDKSDFELARRFQHKKILCYSGEEVKNDPILSPKIVEVQKGKIEFKDAVVNTELKQVVMSKMVYILLKMSKLKNSEFNYLNDENLLIENLQKKCQKWQILETSVLKQEIDFGKLGKSARDKEYCYDQETLFFKIGSSNRDKARGICEYLFANRTLTDMMELIVFHKEVDLLKKEQVKAEMELMLKRWKPNYAKKFEAFSKQILEPFGLLNDFDDKWYCYSKKSKSPILREIDKAGALPQLKDQIEKIKALEEYVGYFDDFKLEIDIPNLNLIAEALNYLKSTNKPEAIITHYDNQLSKWASKLEGEAQIQTCIEEIRKKYRDFRFSDNPETTQKMVKELEHKREIDSIYEQIQQSGSKKMTTVLNTGEVRLEDVPIISDKTIYTNNEQLGESHTQTGSNGEIEVLGECITEFLKLNIDDRKKGLQSVYKTLCEKIKPEEHSTFENRQKQCLTVITEDSKLRKELIPFFYLTMHYKYAFFDIITYKDGKPTFIEVKTTKNDSKSFFMSLAELEFARSEKNYEIVRVTTSERINIGNPIMDFESKFKSIRSDNYEITPVKYKLSFL